MEVNKRALWTSLVADLEEEYKAPPLPSVPPVPPQDKNGNNITARSVIGSDSSNIRNAPIPSSRLFAPGISTLARRGEMMDTLIASTPSFSNGLMYGHHQPSTTSSSLSTSGRSWTCGLSQSIPSRFHQPLRPQHRNISLIQESSLSSPAGKFPTVLPHRMPLRDWITHYAKNRPVDEGTSNISSWRGPSQHSKVDKTYLERCVQVALSLTTKMDNQSTDVHDVTLDNIVIVNTRNRETDFVKRSSNGTDTVGHPRNQRLEICALGRLFYELFSQGSSPPPPKNTHQDSLQYSNAFNRAATNSSKFFGRISMNVDGDENTEEEEGQQNRPQRRRRENSRDREQSISALLDGKGLPSSICRMVADMLENESIKDDTGGLFCHDNAMATIRDLMGDLKQMVDNPKSFLHDSLLARWKPVVVDKMYCRDVELQQALDVAGRVSQVGNQVEELGDSPKAHEVLMVSGYPGSGKSRFVRELSIKLEKKGWRCLSCKFDRVNSRPLSFIISAFDRFFAKLLNDSNLGDNNVEIDNVDLREIRKRLESFSNENISILCHLIPNLRHIVSNKELSCEAYHLSGGQFDFADTEASKARLHHLFGLLVKAISQKPVMLFLDDLHWADEASLDLMMALIHGIGEEISEETTIDAPGEACLLFVGSFRTNEVAGSDPLAVSLKHAEQLSDVTLTEISLNGLSCIDVNVMVSEALCYPQRLTRTLSDLIHQKSTGNPLFIKEILHDLAVENLLNYSLSSRKWQWDEDLIQARTVSDGVAEILTRRLLRLPESVLTALRVLSIFGSEVPMQVLSHVRNVCGIADIIAELERPTKECLIQRTAGGDAVGFVHDMIQHAVDIGINPEARTSMLKEISKTLLVRTSEDRADAVSFILVDLINRVGPSGALSPVDRICYANLNLVAGEKAMQTPDYGSANTYLESGISFLEKGHWRDNYNLSLHLFKKSAFVQHAQGETELMMARINEVLNNARNFNDKLDSLNVLIQSLSLDANSVSSAFNQSLMVLEQLGESFPSTAENEFIGRELIDVKNRLEKYVPSSISKIPPMKNENKIKAINFLLMMTIQCYQQKSRFFPLVAARIVSITLQYGMHEKSAFGFCSFALSYATVFKDMSKGYKLGKYALAITTSKNIPEVYLMLYGGVNIWKEPVQAILPELTHAYKIGMEAGNISFSLLNSTVYVYRAFFSGSKLSSLSKEVPSFLRLYSLYKRHTLHMCVTPINNAIISLVGRNRPLVWENKYGTKDDDEILAKALEIKELNVGETVVVCKMMYNFIFRKLDEAETVAQQYLEFFERHDSALLNFINIYRLFYGGLIALGRFRKNGGQFWMDIGERSISQFEAWNTECEWNFQNKLLLLQAELHFTKNEVTEAEHTYNLAISSSRDHRFVHEQGLSCELAGIFYRVTNRKEHSMSLIRQAAECYTSWGAHEKANALLLSLE